MTRVRFPADASCLQINGFAVSQPRCSKSAGPSTRIIRQVVRPDSKQRSEATRELCCGSSRCDHKTVSIRPLALTGQAGEGWRNKKETSRPRVNRERSILRSRPDAPRTQYQAQLAKCTCRKSNPGLKHGRLVCCRYTTGALAKSWFLPSSLSAVRAWFG